MFWIIRCIDFEIPSKMNVFDVCVNIQKTSQTTK